MLVAPDGTSLVAAGLDHWFEREGEGADTRDRDLGEFQFEEWRLERRLGVDHFRLPPDYRRPRRGTEIPNCDLSVPFLRFPRWHFCWLCKRLTYLPLTAVGRRECPHCAKEGKHPILAQVPFVAMCDEGHLNDFPWREWVHRSADPQCKEPLKLYATGGATLANQLVKCECGQKRTLARIVEGSSDGSQTHVSSSLSAEGEFNCRGVSPQHGTTNGVSCPRPLRGSLRSASNLYFSVVRSAIYLPRTSGSAVPELLEVLRDPRIKSKLALLSSAMGEDLDGESIRDFRPQALASYSDAEIEEAAGVVIAEVKAMDAVSDDLPDGGDDQEAETQFRLDEAVVLREQVDTPELTVRTADVQEYKGITREVFARIQLVERLRETRVLYGFNRVFPERDESREERLAQLWESPPPRNKSWLPGYQVFGEGIYLELDEDLVASWETTPSVISHVERLRSNFSAVQAERQLHDRDLSARFLLVHSLAHVLMNQLTFECGYSSAALRERLYVKSSDDGEQSLAAMLIYTAAGDAEGTMGGLVRMGGAGFLETVVSGALEQARWCGADPVCMEIGSTIGQGPDSCNLAACHSCSLVPETACEEFNRFLDRGVLIGTLTDRTVGFFNSVEVPTGSAA